MSVDRVRTRSRLLAAVGTLAALAASAGAPAHAAPSSLPQVDSGARPGPDLLYAPAPDAPQLQNAAPWSAAPILVSGAEAYRSGEFLYQDFLFDDHGGAASAEDPNDPFSRLENLFAPKHGTLSYPTDTETFANNAADLVELRVKPLQGATAFRVTLNTLKVADRTAFTIALGNSSIPLPWPHGAGVSSPAQYFLTVHGNSAELLSAATGTAVAPAPTASVDMNRRQIDVRVPHAAWNPGSETVRMAAGVGLWDPQASSYLKPGPVASATNPGGASASNAALFNMAFRTNEPIPRINFPGTANTIVEGHVGVAQDGSWWRERRQGDALASGDVSQFSASVDFGKLAAGGDDDEGVPKTGHIDRIFASRFEFGQGVDYDQKCISNVATSGNECTGRYVGRLQPYGLYVPRKPLPKKGYGLVMSMHGLSANYNEFLGSNEVEQFGDRGTGSIVAAPEGRGPDGGYKSYAEADVFEMWADVARHYSLNPDMTNISGYSMGGQGTYRLAGRWPDLFARAFPIVGPPPVGGDSFTSLRNVPVMAWYAQTDELVGPEMSEAAFLSAQQAGIRYDHWVFAPAGHITLGNNDEYAAAANFLGDHEVDRNPAHVSYAIDPAQDPEAQSPADHAYWLSGITPSSEGGAGTIDVRSHGFGVGDPPVKSPEPSAGTLNGGSHGPLPYTRRDTQWGETPKEPKENRLEVDATGIGAVTIDAQRAGVGCDAVVDVTSDGPLKLTLAGCGVKASAPGGRSTVGCVPKKTLTLKLPQRAHGKRVVAAKVTARGRRAKVTRRRNRVTAKLSLRGIKDSRVRVRTVLTLKGGGRVVKRHAYRTCASKKKR